MRRLPRHIGKNSFRGLSPWIRGLPAGSIIAMIELGSWPIPREGGLTLRDSPEALLLEAELPALPLSERALGEIASGALQGLSIEFRCGE